MEWWQLALLALVGVASGFLNVMAGGGSLLSVPVMLFLGLPGPVANGTNRIAILAQNLTAIRAFARRGYAEFRLSLSLAACAIPGAALGAQYGTRLEGAAFERVVALIMIAVMLIMFFGGDRVSGNQGQGNPDRRRLWWGHILMVGVGFYGGFIQLGVGFLIMPLLHRVLGFDLIRTNMHKVFIIACYTAVALLVFAANVEILWWVGLSLAVGNATGGWLATHLQVKQGEGLVRRVLYLVLAAFIVKLLLFPSSV